MSVKKKKVLVSLFVNAGAIMADFVEAGGDRLHSVVRMSVGESCFYLSEARAWDEYEYEIGGEPLEVSGEKESRYLKFGGRQLVASLGEAAAADRIASIVHILGGLSRPVWQDVFRELPVSRAVSMAVSNERLVPHLSPEAAALYAAEHSDLVESGHML